MIQALAFPGRATPGLLGGRRGTPAGRSQWLPIPLWVAGCACPLVCLLLPSQLSAHWPADGAELLLPALAAVLLRLAAAQPQARPDPASHPRDQHSYESANILRPLCARLPVPPRSSLEQALADHRRRRVVYYLDDSADSNASPGAQEAAAAWGAASAIPSHHRLPSETVRRRASPRLPPLPGKGTPKVVV